MARPRCLEGVRLQCCLCRAAHCWSILRAQGLSCTPAAELTVLKTTALFEFGSCGRPWWVCVVGMRLISSLPACCCIERTQRGRFRQCRYVPCNHLFMECFIAIAFQYGCHASNSSLLLNFSQHGMLRCDQRGFDILKEAHLQVVEPQHHSTQELVNHPSFSGRPTAAPIQHEHSLLLGHLSL